MSLEVKYPTGEVVEVDEEFKVVREYGPRKLITNGIVAFEIFRDTGVSGKKREFFLAAYEKQQREQKQMVEIAAAPLRKTDEAKIATRMAGAQAAREVSAIAIHEAEAQQFINAVADPVEINPNDWFECVLKHRLSSQPILIGEFENGQSVWIHEREVTRRPAHSLCLAAGTPLFVRMEINRRRDGSTYRYEYRALEAQIDGDPMAMIATGEVTNWSGSCGGARTDCGCSIFLRTRDKGDWLNLNVGDRVEFDLMYSEKRQVWFGCNIRPTGETK